MGFSHDTCCVCHYVVCVAKRYIIGGVYTVMSLFCYLPAAQPRMRERTIVWAYEGEDEVNIVDTYLLRNMLSFHYPRQSELEKYLVRL